MRTLICTAALALSTVALAQQPGPPLPMATPIPQTVPEARDVSFPGTIRLDIDASDVERGVYRVTQTIPLAGDARRITLLFPEWLPGHHSPRGTLAELADIRFTVGGKPVRWTRDPVEVFAFHVDLPANPSGGARELTARFVHTSPLQSSEGRITMTPEMLNLQWEKMSLYPAGHYVRRIRVKPTVTFPRGWTPAGALDGASRSGDRVSWAETDYETLVDSPIFAGAHFRKWDLGNGVTLNAVADEAELLGASPENIARLSALTDEAIAAFGTPPFDRYEFLVALSGRIGGIGLEHLRSSENQLEPKNFTEWAAHDWDRNVLAHELSHAWNGKYRRPADLWTPDYRQPMRDNLLWLYEGQTQFWGLVLAARSDTQSKDVVLGTLASQAGLYSALPGRAWRSVEDTTHDPIIANRKPKPYQSLARGEDYYNEGALVWLEADQIIRAGTSGKRGLDDFARAFFAWRGGERRQLTYDFAEIVRTLNEVHPYGWEDFLRSRMQDSGRPAPLAGIEQAGYRLVWREEPNAFDKARYDDAKVLNLYHSLGLTLDRDGDVGGVRWDGPAFNAGLVSGARIVAVNQTAYDADKFKKAITAAKDGRAIELLVKRGDRFETVSIRYAGGLRYPWLERVGSEPTGLDLLLERRGKSRAK